jgi:fibronectin-binding autotransporter adhesin
MTFVIFTVIRSDVLLNQLAPCHAWYRFSPINTRSVFRPPAKHLAVVSVLQTPIHQTMKSILNHPSVSLCVALLRAGLLPSRVAMIILAAGVVGVGTARAVDYTWDGGFTGGNSTWLTATNWNPDAIPNAVTDNVTFDAAGTATTVTINMATVNEVLQLGALTLSPGNLTPRTIRNNSVNNFGALELNGNNGLLLANYSGVQLSLVNQSAGFTSRPMGVRLAASGEIHVANAPATAQIVIAASISETNGAQGFTKTGPGILYLQGTNNTFTGSITNQQGSVKVNDTATFGSGLAPFYFAGGDLISGSDRSAGVPLANPLVVQVSGFIINDGGTTNTSRTLPLSGPITGPGTLTIANLTPVSDQTFLVRLVGGHTINNDLVIGSGVDTAGSFSALQLFNAETNGVLTLTGTLSGPGSLRRQGATSSAGGTAIVTGDNSYAGGTLVTYGNLLANNLSGSALGAGAVIVTNAGVLGGSGAIVAPVAVSLGGTVTPGAAVGAVGTLSISDLTLGENGAYLVHIADAAGAAGTGYDTITAGSWTDAASSGNAFTIKLDSLGVTPANWNPGVARSWTLIDSSSAAGFDVSHFAIDIAAFLGPVQGIFSLDVVSGDLVLSYVPAADITINVGAGSVTQGQTTPTAYPFLTGPFGVVKVGSGEVVFTNAANDYLGSTRVLAGTLSLAVNAANGSGALGAAFTAVLVGHTSGSSNATLNISAVGVTNSRSITVQAGSTGLKTIGTTTSGGPVVYSGDVALQADAQIAAPAGSDLILAGLVSGTGVATKVGSGGLTLSGANTHGGTVISNGTLNIAGQVGAAFSIAGASTLDNPGPGARTLNASSISWAGDISFAGSTNLSFGPAPVTLNGARQINVASNTLTLAGPISGAGGFTKTGAGTLALTSAGNSDYSGDTTLTVGLTTIGPSTFLGAGTLHLAGGTLGLTGTRNTSTGILPNPVHLTADTILQNTTGAGSGNRFFPFGGPVTASGGTLTIRNIAAANANVLVVRWHAGGINFTRPIVFDNSLAGSPVNNLAQLGLYNTNGTGDQVISGVISGPGIVRRGSLTAGSGGRAILAGNNTYTAGTVLDDGELGLAADPGFAGNVLVSSAVGTGTFEWVGNSALFAHAAARELPNYVYLNGVRLARITGTNTVTFSGVMNVGSVEKSFVTDNSAPTIIAGVMTNSSPLGKDGSGVLVLAGPNQTTGAWGITNGTLVVNGAAGSGSMIVYGPGVLAGTGTVAGAVTLTNGGGLAPGDNGVGSLTLGSDLNFGGNGVFEVNKSVSPSNDVVVVTGVVTNSGSGTITIQNLGPTLSVGDSFKLFNQPVLNGTALSITGGGATWINNLAADGSVQVASVGGGTPPGFAPGGIATLPTGNISLTATGALNMTYKLWATTNVALTPVSTTWTLISSGTVSTSPFVLTDLNATNYPQRFYLFSTP